MTDAEFKKSFNAAEAEATTIIQAQNPKFRKIDGNEFKLFYEQFEIQYKQCKQIIEPEGQKVNITGNQLFNCVVWAKKFMQNYSNTRASYEKSVHFLGASFGRLIGAVQFGFKATNPDIARYRNQLLQEVVEIREIVSTIQPELKLEHIPKRILEIYHQNPREVHFFTVQFAQELSRPS